jgi:hypothetical protein
VSSNASQSARRMTLGALLPGAIAASSLLPLWLWRGRLPDRMATHWSLGGQPDGAVPLATLAVIIAVLIAPAAAGMAFLAYRQPAHRGEVAPPMAICGFIAGLMAVISWMTVSANLDAADWSDAGQVGFAKVLLSLAAGTVLAAIIARVARPLETAAPAALEVPSAGIAPGSRAAWTGSARAGWAVPLTLSLLALAAILARIHIFAGIATALTSLVGLWFTSIRMTVDRHGVRIAFGPLRWPVQRVALGEIRQASVLDVQPMAWGGWGYRGSLKVLKKAAVVLRGGEGVRLDLSGDRILVVTIDNARQAAGLINDLISARARSP